MSAEEIEPVINSKRHPHINRRGEEWALDMLLGRAKEQNIDPTPANLKALADDLEKHLAALE